MMDSSAVVNVMERVLSCDYTSVMTHVQNISNSDMRGSIKVPLSDVTIEKSSNVQGYKDCILGEYNLLKILNCEIC